MEEIWRPVKGYEGLYEVSNEGRVKSLHTHGRGKACNLKTKTKDRHGYWFVQLCKEGVCKSFYVARLVARAFPEICGEWFEGCDVNHKDENPNNNYAWNLEVCTRKYNINYGSHNQRPADSRSIAINQLTREGAFIKKWKSAIEVERELGISRAHIGKCLLGYKYRHTAGGFRWEYAK